jgi:hypothetical protein
MSQKTFTIIASVIFGVVALFHVLRIFLGWPAVIGGFRNAGVLRSDNCKQP